MIKVGALQHHKPACQFRRLSTGNDPARPRAAMDSRRLVRPPLCDAGSAYPDRPVGVVIPSIASQASVQRLSATHRQRRNPHSV